MICKKWKCQILDCKEDCDDCILNTRQVCEDCIRCEDCSLEEEEKRMGIF